MTALTPAYAHPFQTMCAGRRTGDILVHSFRLLTPKLLIVSYPMSEQRHVLQVSTFEDGASSPMEPTRVMVKQLLAGRAVARAHSEVSATSCLAPVIDAEAHAAYAGASIPHAAGISPSRMTCVHFFDSQFAADRCLGSMHARTMFGWRVLADIFSCRHNCVSFSPCSMFIATEVMLGRNVQITRLPAGLLDSCPSTILLNAGRLHGLIPPLSWETRVTLPTLSHTFEI